LNKSPRNKTNRSKYSKALGIKDKFIDKANNALKESLETIDPSE